MLEFYRTLNHLPSSRSTRVLTVVEGPNCGAKAILSGDDLLWERADGFFSAHRTAVPPPDTAGLCEMAGQRVFCEGLGREKRLVICGGGHVGIALVRLCRILGLPVTLLEDRAEFARNARSAGADRVICAPFDEALGEIPGDEDTFFVIVTRAHQFDHLCLRLISRKPHAYIGLMGSKKRVAALQEALLQEGAPADVIWAVHTPIGLSIGAETPEEIAVSILAEVIQIKSSMAGVSYPRPLMEAILAHPEEPKVLATIIHCAGSVPRGVGTRLLARRDGTFVGTIGGGHMELTVLERARQLLDCPKECAACLTVDLTSGPDALLCGGTAEVFLELIS